MKSPFAAPSFAALAILACVTTAQAAPPDAQNGWAVYYDRTAPVEAFNPYRLLVLDSEHHPDLPILRDRGKVLLGYISLGEAEEHRPAFAAIKAEGILLEENATWKGSWMVDLRDRRWTRRVIEQAIPDLLRQGFDGLFLDTLDNAGYLEDHDPVKRKGMRQAAIRLVRAIRLNYPDMPIMLNRAYDLLPELVGQVDMALGESVFATHDFAAKTYRLVPEADYRAQVALLKAARARQPNLQIMTLDYWNPEDKDGLARIYAEERANGFLPYVATIELNRVVPEPPPAQSIP